MHITCPRFEEMVLQPATPASSLSKAAIASRAAAGMSAHAALSPEAVLRPQGPRHGSNESLHGPLTGHRQVFGRVPTAHRGPGAAQQAAHDNLRAGHAGRPVCHTVSGPAAQPSTVVAAC